MFTSKNKEINSFEISELLFKAIIDLATVIQDPKALKSTAEEMRNVIALNDKEKEAREEYKKYISDSSKIRDELLQRETTLNAEIEEHKLKAQKTLEQLSKKEESLKGEREAFAKKVKDFNAEKENFEARVAILDLEEKKVKAREHALNEREASLAERVAKVSELEKKFKSAMAALNN